MSERNWIAETWDGLPAGWGILLQRYFNTEPGIRLAEFLGAEFEQQTVFPAPANLFRALQFGDVADVRVVILGQDPYHGPGQADGLAFSVPGSVKLPPSLRNIFRELQSDLQVTRDNPELSDWARQGVLLLNTTLTVRENVAGSHRGRGWEQLTDQIIHAVNRSEQPAAFVLWGKDAANKQPLLDSSKHLVLMAPHPSPLSAHRGFFGSRPFSKINQFLRQHNRTDVTWA